MTTQELLKKIKKVEVKARGASKQLFTGQQKSPFRGMGMEFAEVRKYFPGDETRAIDWNVTARLNEPFVKTFDEEKELSVMLLVDVSYSTFLGSAWQSKKDYIAEICAVIAFSAINQNEKVGLMLFSGQVEKFVAPGKGKQHVLRLVRELLIYKPTDRSTDINKALMHFVNAQKKRTTSFVVSDFRDASYEKALKIASKRHDLMAVRVQDDFDVNLPSVGLVSLKDAETGQERKVDTSDKRIRLAHETWVAEQNEQFKTLLNQSGLDSVDLLTSEPYIKTLKKVFNRRGK